MITLITPLTRNSSVSCVIEASGRGADLRTVLEGMLQLDTNMSPPTLSNISIPTYIGPRMNGAMIHVPVGEQGVLVQIGGQTTENPTPYGVGIANANAGNVNINNSFVDIYDIQTGYWFRQEAFGMARYSLWSDGADCDAGVPDIPTGRSDICTILVSAPDGSSYNIFMIAGVGNLSPITLIRKALTCFRNV
jgi:hypothetical protein